MSFPCPMGVSPAETDDDAPPLLPPGVCLRDHGLCVRPRNSFTVSRRKLIAGVLVRPMTMAPAFFRFATTGLSVAATRSRYAATPLTVAQPSWSTFSFVVTGMPCNRPMGSPRASDSSAERACAKACSERSTVTALSRGLTSCIRATQAATASGALMSRWRIEAASSAASHVQRGRVTVLVSYARHRLMESGAMSVIAIGGFQHETNTFAPSKADYNAFEQGAGWPPLTSGEAIAPRLDGANIPATGALAALHAAGHRTPGTAWGAASPSAHVTKDAYERIVGEMTARLAQAGHVDGVYLDLHGAMVTEHFDDGEGEILVRVRRIVGPKVPIVASLDLHANVTSRMIDVADGLVAYRT